MIKDPLIDLLEKSYRELDHQNEVIKTAYVVNLHLLIGSENTVGYVKKRYPRVIDGSVLKPYDSNSDYAVHNRAFNIHTSLIGQKNTFINLIEKYFARRPEIKKIIIQVEPHDDFSSIKKRGIIKCNNLLAMCVKEEKKHPLATLNIYYTLLGHNLSF